MFQPMNVVRLQADPEQVKKYQPIRDADAQFKSALNAMYLSQNKDNLYASQNQQLGLNGNKPNQSWSSPETMALQSKMNAMKGGAQAAADQAGIKTMSSRDAGNMVDSQTPAQRGIQPYGSSGGGGFGGASGGIGANPFGSTGTMQPRSVQTQMFNRPAYQRNRVTTGQMGEMNRSNQDRFRSEVKPLTTAFNRNFNQANAQQQLADTAASDQYSNQFFGLTNQYNQQQNAMNQQMLMPMLSQLFGGF